MDGAPSHADVVVFDWPQDPDKAFVKRLVGLPGDTLAVRGGVLHRNGITVREPYLFAGRGTGANSQGVQPPRDDWGPVVVPPRSKSSRIGGRIMRSCSRLLATLII